MPHLVHVADAAAARREVSKEQARARRDGHHQADWRRRHPCSGGRRGGRDTQEVPRVRLCAAGSPRARRALTSERRERTGDCDVRTRCTLPHTLPRHGAPGAAVRPCLAAVRPGGRPRRRCRRRAERAAAQARPGAARHQLARGRQALPQAVRRARGLPAGGSQGGHARQGAQSGGGEASLSVGRPRASARALAHTPPKTAQRGRAGWCALLLLAGGGSWVAPALTRRCGGHATRRACVAREEGGVALLAPRPITRAAPCYLGASASACAILWGCGLRPASAIGDGINQMPTPVSRKARLARTSTKCASSPRLACSWSVFGPPFAAARLPARPLTVGYG